jgi:hypothetical protein
MQNNVLILACSCEKNPYTPTNILMNIFIYSLSFAEPENGNFTKGEFSLMKSM